MHLMKSSIPFMLPAALLLLGGGFVNLAPATNAKPDLKLSKPTDDSGNCTMSEPGTQGGVFSLTLKPDGSFPEVTCSSRI